jgi:lipoate-protein ligase A
VTVDNWTAGPDTWRRLPYHVGDSARHFIQSDALARVSTQPTLWWHSTERPTLILGAGQTGLDLARCEAAGVLAVRRQAGGTAVYAEKGVLGLDLMLPAGHRLAPPDVLETYRPLGELWNSALRSLGLPTRVVSVAEARRAASSLPPDAPIRVACFGTLSPYEVAVGNRKLVGLAQVRRRNGVLLQSAIHRRFYVGRLAALLGMEGPDDLEALRSAAIGLDELGELSPNDVMDAFEHALKEERRVQLADGDWSAAERAYIETHE